MSARTTMSVPDMRAAEALGTRCAWTVINVPDVGHDGERMSNAALPLIAAALHGAGA